MHILGDKKYAVVLHNTKYLIVLRQWHMMNSDISVLNHFGSFDSQEIAERICALKNRIDGLESELGKAREIILGIGDKALGCSARIAEVLNL